MINDPLQYYPNRLIVEPAEYVTSTILSTLSLMTNQIALEIIVQVAITAPPFYLHYNLFALGFTIGFAFADELREMVKKVDVVYNAQRSALERVLLVGIGTPLILITMPTSIVIATLYYSARWGAFLYHDSLRKQGNPQPVNLFPPNPTEQQAQGDIPEVQADPPLENVAIQIGT